MGKLIPLKAVGDVVFELDSFTGAVPSALRTVELAIFADGGVSVTVFERDGKSGRQQYSFRYFLSPQKAASLVQLLRLDLDIP